MENHISFEDNPQIKAAINIALISDQSCTVHGGAGTGKSTFIRYLMKQEEVLTLAPTGIAAKNIDGSTIHSALGISPHILYPEEDFERSIKIGRDHAEWLHHFPLVIVDECSMVNPGLMECTSRIFQIVHSNKKPFGGKQMIFVGDPFQLPPVIPKEEDKQKFTELYGGIYFFDSPAYQQLDPLNIPLSKNYRQQDTEFIDCLNKIRTGEGAMEAIKKINKTCLK